MRNTEKETDLALETKSISLFRELIAYEALWNRQSESLKSIAERFSSGSRLPSEVLTEVAGLLGTDELTNPVEKFIRQKEAFSVLLRSCYQYPIRLRDARHPIELLYYRGDIGLLDSSAVAVVGARDCTPEGEEVAHRVSKQLVRGGFSIASGLARGIDTVALKTALENDGHVLGVIGTPIDEYYPKENRELQNYIAHNHLLVSHVPFFRYYNEPFRARRFRFPERNSLMSAISVATVIVEASDKSGTLTQARACLEQGRQLFITENCFRNPSITWPTKYVKKGAIRVANPREILDLMKAQHE